MIKNLVKNGNSWAVVIDRPILDLLKIDRESQLELTTDGRSIRIAPVNSDDNKAKVRAARAINDESLIANDDELVDLVLKTTAVEIGKREIAEFFRYHCS